MGGWERRKATTTAAATLLTLLTVPRGGHLTRGARGRPAFNLPAQVSDPLAAPPRGPASARLVQDEALLPREPGRPPNAVLGGVFDRGLEALLEVVLRDAP